MKSYIFAAALLSLAIVGCSDAPKTHNTREYNVMTLHTTSRQLSSNYSAAIRAGSEVSNALALCSSAQGKTDVRIRQVAPGIRPL